MDNQNSFRKFGVVIVFGLSGVGKTAACASYVRRHQDVLHVSAGELLRNATSLSDEALRTGSTATVLDNQLLLGTAFVRWLANRQNSGILIDAHSVIDNDQGIVEVPVNVVQALRPDGLVLLEAEPGVLLARREHDPRQRPVRSLENLSAQTLASRKACIGYAKELNVPLEIGRLANEMDLDGLIEAVTSQSRFNENALRSKGLMD